jgi:hypothetical protein
MNTFFRRDKMQIDDARRLCPGDQVNILSNIDSFTVMLQPEIKGRGGRAFARITAFDSLGRTRIFINDEVTRIMLSKHVRA